MAYTYDDFVTAANNAGVMNRFSEKDLSVAQTNPEYGMSMVGLLQDVSNATTAEGRLLATEAANQMRKNYGVYGIGDSVSDSTYASSYGTKIDELLGKVDNYGSYSYGDQETYQKLLDSVANQGSFSYDPESDASYSAYKKAYNREGERASANALAQAAAASGGRASSYALTAAQQAGNYYAGQLADVIPTLEENAYQRYLNDFNNRLSSLNAMTTDREFDYQNWMNEYNMLQNSLGNYQGQDATDYQRYLEQVNQKQQAYENALALYNALGYATPEVAEILGISAGTAASTSTGGYSGYSSGGGSSVTDSDDDSADGLTVDMKSIINLGYGPVSESKLNELVASGEVKEVLDGNVIRFEKVTTEQPQKNTGTTTSETLASSKTNNAKTSKFLSKFSDSMSLLK